MAAIASRPAMPNNGDSFFSSGDGEFTEDELSDDMLNSDGDVGEISLASDDQPTPINGQAQQQAKPATVPAHASTATSLDISHDSKDASMLSSSTGSLVPAKPSQSAAYQQQAAQTKVEANGESKPVSPFTPQSQQAQQASPQQQYITSAKSIDTPPLVVCQSVDLSKVTKRSDGEAFAIPSDYGTRDSKPRPVLDHRTFKQPNTPSSVASSPAKPAVTAAQADAAGISGVDKKTGLDLPSPLQLLLMYDTDGSRAIGMSEFKQMLFDLDGLQGVDPRSLDEYVRREFHSADLNHDGIISIDEFYFYFYKELCFKFPVLRTGVNPGADLFNIFTKYCSSGKQFQCQDMTSGQFVKLCKDAKLINDRVRKSDIDIIYSRAKAETEVNEVQQHRPGAEWTTSKISYAQFLFALLRLAEKRRSGFQEVVSRIISNIMAVPAASQADLLIFHCSIGKQDTQIEEWLLRPRGLPALPRVANDSSERLARESLLAQSLQLPGNKQNDQSSLLQQDSIATSPGQMLASTEKRKKWNLESYGSAETLGLSCTGKQALANPEALLAVRELNPDHMMMALKRTFERYNLWEHGTNKAAMDRIRFAKVMRDAGLVSESGLLTSGATDSIFARTLPPGKARLNFIEFVGGLRHIATCLRVSLNEVMERIVLVNEPLLV